MDTPEDTAPPVARAVQAIHAEKQEPQPSWLATICGSHRGLTMIIGGAILLGGAAGIYFYVATRP